MATLTKEEERILKNRWKTKRAAIYNLADNIDRLKRAVHKDLNDKSNEKDQLTALVIRVLMKTSERVGNESSGHDSHFGITEFRQKHISFCPPTKILLHYVGKAGVKHEKEFCDETSYKLIKKLWWRDNIHILQHMMGSGLSRTE